MSMVMGQAAFRCTTMILHTEILLGKKNTTVDTKGLVWKTNAYNVILVPNVSER